MYTFSQLRSMKSAQVQAITQKAQAFLETVHSAEDMAAILADAPQFCTSVRARLEVRIAAALCDEVELACTKTHHQITDETLEWGGYLSGDVFNTTDQEAIAKVFA